MSSLRFSKGRTAIDFSGIAADPNLVKFVGNVPAGKPAGGTLRHKGWRAGKADLPALAGKQDVHILAPAEIEIE